MPDPSISIVVPAYNAAVWIGDTIESILQLRFPSDALEIVVVNDGSMDETAQIVRYALRQSPFKWSVADQENSGPARARNSGWQRARGEWIQFLDADDLLMPSKLEVQWPAAVAAEATVAVVYSAWTTLEKTGTKWVATAGFRMPRVSNDPVLELLEPDNFIATGSQLIRRAWLVQVAGFNEAYDQIEDVDLALRLAIAGGRFKPVLSDGPLFLYRHHEGSLSRRSGLRFVEGCVRNAMMVESFWKARQTNLHAQQRRVLLAVYGQGLRYFFEHDRARFNELLDHVHAIANPYRPSARALRALTSVVGYRGAESVALAFRRLKKHLGMLR